MSRLRTALIAVALFAALAPAAHARINGPRITSTDVACGAIQDEGDRLRAEYAGLSPYDPRREEILQRLRNLGADWNAAGCRAAYGGMARTNVLSAGATGGPTAGASQPPRIVRHAARVGVAAAAPN